MIEKCTHQYYKLENERLLCVSCGAPSTRKWKIEDKEKKRDSEHLVDWQPSVKKMRAKAKKSIS